MVPVLGQDLSRPGIRRSRSRQAMEGVGVLVDHGDGNQSCARIPAWTHTLVIANLGEGFADNQVGNDDRGVRSARGDNVRDRPSVMTVAAVDRGDQQAAVGEGGQRP